MGGNCTKAINAKVSSDFSDGKRPRGRPAVVSRPQDMLSDEQQGFELSDLYHPQSKWTPEEKIAAIQAYNITGDAVRASKICGIPDSTIRWWKSNASWWQDVLMQVRKEKNDEVDAKLNEVRDKAVINLLQRLELGDEVITKDGDIRFKQMTGRDLGTIVGIFQDKIALLRGDPTSIASRGNQDALTELQNRFEKFAKQMQDSGNMAKPIEGEVVDASKK